MLITTVVHAMLSLLKRYFFERWIMMTRLLIGAVWALLSLCKMAHAQADECRAATCSTDVYVLHSASDARTYGLLMTLPHDAPCDVARFVVLDMANRPLGQTGLLMPGEQGRVRLGHGFAAGRHALHLRVSGCATRPVMVRGITINKTSPDHGWRARALIVMADWRA
jgi:hypothetical protein